MNMQVDMQVELKRRGYREGAEGYYPTISTMRKYWPRAAKVPHPPSRWPAGPTDADYRRVLADIDALLA